MAVNARLVLACASGHASLDTVMIYAKQQQRRRVFVVVSAHELGVERRPVLYCLGALRRFRSVDRSADRWIRVGRGHRGR